MSEYNWEAVVTTGTLVPTSFCVNTDTYRYMVNFSSQLICYQMCLERDYKKRASIDQLLEHAYVK